MSTRNRERKARKLAVEQAVRSELKERYYLRTAPVRQWTKSIGLMLAGLVVVAGLVFGAVKVIKMMDTNVSGPFGKISKQELSQNKFATLTTSQGDIKIELDAKTTPKTVANFVLLAKKNFFDGIRFHRVIKDFMIQTGDPNSKDADQSNDGTGGPGYQFNDEKVVGNYDRGVVAMANSGVNTNGSKFFIMHKDNSTMPKNYVIFGKVVAGMEIVDKIANLPVEDNGQGEQSRPKEAITINKIVLSAQ